MNLFGVGRLRVPRAPISATKLMVERMARPTAVHDCDTGNQAATPRLTRRREPSCAARRPGELSARQWRTGKLTNTGRISASRCVRRPRASRCGSTPRPWTSVRLRCLFLHHLCARGFAHHLRRERRQRNHRVRDLVVTALSHSSGNFHRAAISPAQTYRVVTAGVCF